MQALHPWRGARQDTRGGLKRRSGAGRHEFSCPSSPPLSALILLTSNRTQALHDAAARNKTFEVCSEIAAEPGAAAYELVAHLPDRSNNYLTPALAGLEKNT